MATISFARHQFPPAIIRHAVWLYARFTLSYRDVEELRMMRKRQARFAFNPRPSLAEQFEILAAWKA